MGFKWWCLVSGVVTYSIGVGGLITNRRSLILVLVSLEVALLGLFLCFSAVGAAYELPVAQLGALLVLVGAASESAVALALVICYKKTGSSLWISRSRRLRG